MRYRILPYRAGSRSATALAEALGGRVLRLQGSTFRPRRDDVIINWGFTGTHPILVDAAPVIPTYINNPGAIRNASNKLEFFNRMPEGLCPQHWTNERDIPDEAFENGGRVVCRTILAGHSGAGIVIASNRGELVRCSLYVKYVKKQEEYRVHCGIRNAGEEPVVISVQRKARNTNVENPNWQIRNHANGFVFVRGGVVPPPMVIDTAKRSLTASGLDFGAVDVIWNQQQERAYALEINTAPGLEGQTVTDYTSFFRGQ